ncbi:hypothetical protein [Mangrovimonas cancribranchiae]|uniref:Uncharacterized protein n=1 Tax=Mangrovimonas cancribranchiae TaxID=3080055 RepID=A0AAU6NYG9_9FLAO
MKKRFVLVQGYVSMDNDTLYVENNKHNIVQDLKSKTILPIIAGILLYNIIQKQKFNSTIETTKEIILLGFQWLGLIVIILIIAYLIFKIHWSNKIIINNLKKIEIDNSDDFVTEMTLTTVKNREKHMEFRKLENQLEPFLEEIKKRNSRIKIKYK